VPARLLALAALGLAACGSPRPPIDQPSLDHLDHADAAPKPDAAPAPDAAPPGPSTFTIPRSPVTVVRLTRGKGTAGVLRYALIADTAQVADHTVEVVVDVTLAGAKAQRQASPSQGIGGTIEVVRIDGGSAMVRETMQRVTVADATMTDQLEQLKASFVESAIDAQGRTGEVAVTSPAPAAETAGTVAGLIQSRVPIIVLPDEPIGVGGTWRVSSRHDVNQVVSDVTTTYTLKSRNGDVLVVTGVIAATAKPQTVTRAEGTIDVKSMTGRGTIRATIDLRRPAPATEVDETYDLMMAVPNGEVRVVSTVKSSQTVRDRLDGN
jgi:hypothetical protein